MFDPKDHTDFWGFEAHETSKFVDENHMDGMVTQGDGYSIATPHVGLLLWIVMPEYS